MKKQRQIWVLVISTFLLVTVSLPTVFGQGKTAGGKGEVIGDVARKWIEVGSEQYRRGFYRQAKKSFLLAGNGQDYLSALEQEQLKGLLSKTQEAMIERERALGCCRTANDLVKKSRILKARVYFEKIRDNKYLTADERKQIEEKITKIDSDWAIKEKEIIKLYERSMEFYRVGELKKARDCFAGIDNILSKFTMLSDPNNDMPGQLAVPKATVVEVVSDLIGAESKAVAQEKVAMPEPKEAEESNKVIVRTEPNVTEPFVAGGNIVKKDSGIRREKILRNYTKAVVDDAMTKAHDYISQGRFDKVKAVVEEAQHIVDEYRAYLEESFIKEYNKQLEQLEKKVALLDN